MLFRSRRLRRGLPPVRPAVDRTCTGRWTPCGRCGEDGPTVTSARIISPRSFTRLRRAGRSVSRRLCVVPCAWAYNPSNRPPSRPLLNHRHRPTVKGVLLPAAPPLGRCSSTDGPLSSAPGRGACRPAALRRHILPTCPVGSSRHRWSSSCPGMVVAAAPAYGSGLAAHDRGCDLA